MVGNATGVGGRYRIGHSVMKDALDQDGIWEAIKDAGLDLPERPRTADLDGRLVNVFLKCEAFPAMSSMTRRAGRIADTMALPARASSTSSPGLASDLRNCRPRLSRACRLVRARACPGHGVCTAARRF